MRIKSYLEGNEEFKADLAGYDGSAELAISDIGVVLTKALEGGLYSDPDTLAIFALSVLDLINNNQSMIQVLGYLRANDWFYNDGIIAAVKDLPADIDI